MSRPRDIKATVSRGRDKSTGLVLPADLMALVQVEAGDVPVLEWLGRAVRAYAKAPMTAAERQRARRAKATKDVKP